MRLDTSAIQPQKAADRLEAKLLAGNTGYDIVVPSASFMERQIKAGVFQKLDKSALTNWGNLDPEIMERVALHDPGNAHSLPLMWGTTGIGYNEAKRWSDEPEEFGKGSIEGIAGSEAANNSATGGAMVPTLALGIPGSATTAVLIGAMIAGYDGHARLLHQPLGGVLQPHGADGRGG